MNEQAPKVLVTGGAGYVGSVLVPHLLSEGFRVQVVDNLRQGGLGILPNFIHPNFQFAEVDILETRRLKELAADADMVVHLAAIVGYPACKKWPEEARRTNLGGTLSLLEAIPDTDLSRVATVELRVACEALRLDTDLSKVAMVELSQPHGR